MPKNNRKVSLYIVLVCVVLTGLICFLIFSPWLKTTVANWAKGRIVSYFDHNTDYKIEMDSLVIVGFRTVEIYSVHLIPKLGKEEFNQKNEYESDWIKVDADKLIFKDIYWRNWIKDRGVRMETLQIIRPDLYVFRDKRKPKAPFKEKPLPAFHLRNTDFSVTIPLIEVKEGKVKYEEKTTDYLGGIVFTQLYSSIYHVSTDSEYHSEQPDLKADFRALMADSVQVQVAYSAKINDDQDRFTLKGSAESFAAPVLNTFLEPMAKVKVEEGFVEKIAFAFEATNDVADGKMRLDYRDLKLSVHKEDSSGKKESKLKTFIANLLVRDENKKELQEEEGKKENYKEGKIHFVRAKDRSLFHYWLNAVKSGMMTVITDVDPKAFKMLGSKKAKQD